MNEQKNVKFYNGELTKSSSILSRANKQYLEEELKKIFPQDSFEVSKVYYNQKGKYISPNKTFITIMFGQKDIKNLPPFIEVVLKHKTGNIDENIIVWTPIEWNERFMGTAGGGMAVGGYSQITTPNNAARGMNLPKALINHFSCATSDGGQKETMYGFDKDGQIVEDLLINWIDRSTHNMAIFGKAITEILQNKKIKYSYLHGGSGGGRQSLDIVQKHPEDFNGIWASCPAINWQKFILLTYYYLGVMNDNHHYLSKNKLNFFMNRAQEYFGSSENYFNTTDESNYNPYDDIGKIVNKKETITEIDAKVMKEMWDGPTKDGKPYGLRFRKGVQFWYSVLPICSLYFPLFKNYPTDSAMYRHYARLLVKDKNKIFKDISLKEFYELYDFAIKEYPNHLIDDANLVKAKEANLKIFIDHGTDDPLIPVDSTIEYYQKVIECFNNKKEVDKFIKLFITPGDGHGNCNYHNCGISESDGMKSLIDWVEKDIEPKEVRTIQVDKKGNLIKESTIKPM